MSWLYIIVGIVTAAVLIFVARVRFHIWGSRPAVYEIATAPELTPFVRSWGRQLDDRGRIVVRPVGLNTEVEFRMRRCRTRPDQLLFRCRNADANRATFTRVRAAFDAAGVDYQAELTVKRRLDRALAVPLDAQDVHTPAAAARLIEVAFGRDVALSVYCEGRMRSDGTADSDAGEMIPWRHGHRAGYNLGLRLGNVLRAIMSAGGSGLQR